MRAPASQNFLRRSRLPVSAEEAFRWHERPGAFERLIPPWEDVRLVEQTGGIKDGAVVKLENHIGPVRLKWTCEHRDYVAGQQFRDIQLSGPFAHWNHLHRFEPDGADACFLEDRIQFAVPAGAVGRTLTGSTVERKLDQMFAYRHATTVGDLEAHDRHRDSGVKTIAVTGSSGLVGSSLVPFLTTGGHQVLRIRRQRTGTASTDLSWDPASGQLQGDLENLDAVVHLAGENIAAGRWTKAQKARIRDSRVVGTRRLCESLAKLANPPKVLVCASAIGYYGDRGTEALDESCAPGEGFLADVCHQWEAAADPVRDRGIRVVHLRFGIILSPRGGALTKMLTPFRMGMGGRVGTGKQYWSWISLDDAIGAIHHAMLTDSLDGPVNGVAPEPVTNAEFTRCLAKVLKRPAFFPMPATAARLALGELANDLLLASTRVVPGKLLDSGYTFRHAELEAALRHLLGKHR